MNTGHQPQSDPDAASSNLAPPQPDRKPNDLEQVIERTESRYMADLQTLSRHLSGRLGASERDQATSKVQRGERRRLQAALPGSAETASPGVSDPEPPVPQLPVVPAPGPSAVARDAIDDFREYPAQLQAEQQASDEPVPPQTEGSVPLFSYRTVILVAVCGLAVLLTIGIVLARRAPRRDSVEPTVVVPSLALEATALITPVPASAVPSPTTSTVGGTSVASIATAPATAPITTASTPTTDLSSASAWFQRVATAEAALRTGQFEATIDYGGGNRAAARVRFDLGDVQHVPRLHMITTYQSATSSQTSERITIGDQSWQSQPDGQWMTMVEQEGAWGQVQNFLPHAALVANAEIVSHDPTILHWYDSGRDADITLQIDSSTGAPYELRQVPRHKGASLSVTYSGWNKPVDIAPPVGS
jgi:hypothetical protein